MSIQDLKDYLIQFDSTLKNEDLDNIVDNGVFQEDSYLDGKQSRTEKLLKLSSILRNPDYQKTFFEKVGDDYVFKFIEKDGLSWKVPNWNSRSDIFQIGMVDEDEVVNKYLNFEYIYRLVWYKTFSELDIDDDETRAYYHGMWVNHKKILYPNGVIPLRSMPNSTSSKEIKKNIKNIEGKIDKNTEVDSTEEFTATTEFFESDADASWNSNDFSTNTTKKNTTVSSSAVSDFFLDLNKFGNYNNRYLKKAKSTRVNGKPRFYEILNNNKQNELYFNDLKSRLGQLVLHMITAASLMLLPFIKMGNAKKFLLISCDPDTNDQSRMSFLSRLFVYNQLEPLRWYKSLGPIFGITAGAVYFLNSNKLINYELSESKKTEVNAFVGIFIVFYIIYQVFLLMPLHHDESVAKCIARRLWGKGENFLIVLVVLITIFMTSLALNTLWQFMLTIPFAIFLVSYLGKEYKNSFDVNLFNKYVYDNPEAKFQNTLFKWIIYIGLLIISLEMIDCTLDHFQASNLFINITMIIKLSLMIIGVGIGPLLFVYHVYSTNKSISESETPRAPSGSIEDVQSSVSQKFEEFALWLKKMGATFDFLTNYVTAAELRIEKEKQAGELAQQDAVAKTQNLRDNKLHQQRIKYSEMVEDITDRQLKAGLEQWSKHEANIDKNKNSDAPSKQKMKEMVANIIIGSIGRNSDVSRRRLATLDKQVYENMEKK